MANSLLDHVNYIYEQNEIFAINKTEIKEQSLGDPVNRFKLCSFAISILNGMSSDHDFRDTRRHKNFVHLVSLHCIFIWFGLNVNNGVIACQKYAKIPLAYDKFSIPFTYAMRLSIFDEISNLDHLEFRYLQRLWLQMIFY